MEHTQNPSAQVANEGLLKQGYFVVASSERLAALYSLLKSIWHKKKVMVLFSTCYSVKFHSALLRRMMKVDDGYYLHEAHGMQKHSQWGDILFNFWKADNGILLCTDVVIRGCDLPPNVDWIVQYDPPDRTEEYISRVGRWLLCGSTIRRVVLLFLTPEELQFCKYLKAIRAPLMKYTIKDKKLENVQSDLESLVARNHSLKKLARAAYRSFILSYKSHHMKNIFNVKMLDSKAVAASFCLSSSPVKVSINRNVEEITARVSELTCFQAEQTMQAEEPMSS